MAAKLKAAICGASGYAGAELLRVLHAHPMVEVTAATSERSAGMSVPEVFPHLPGYAGITLEQLDAESLAGKADVFFMALPHKTSQPAVAELFKKGKLVIDLSADFRLRDKKTYELWYKTPHTHPQALSKAVYGLPELYRGKIKKARLVANPGCYPTGAILGTYPALKSGIAVSKGIVVDSKSGASGAGRQADPRYGFCEINEDFTPYAVASHRHTPEIEQELSVAAGQKVIIDFTPHLLPVNRGIISTIYLRLAEKIDTARALSIYRKFYKAEPFVRVLGEGQIPSLKNVKGTNRCDIGLKANPRTGSLIVVTAIDNLVKGAAGQAVQNLNLMAGFPEDMALAMPALHP